MNFSWWDLPVKLLSSATSYQCHSSRKRTSKFLWSCCIRLSAWLRKEIATEPLHTITLPASSVEPRSCVAPYLTLRKPSRSSITICISANKPSMSAFRSRIHATSTWIFARSSPKWASMSSLCSTLWRRSFWFRMSSSQKFLRVDSSPPSKISNRRLVKAPCLDCLSRAASPRTVSLSSASPITTSLSSRSSSNSTKLRSTRMPRQLSQPLNISAICTLWHRIWMKCWLRRPRRSPLSSRRPWLRARNATRRVCQWLS